MLTQMQRDHLKAETQAKGAGRTFTYWQAKPNSARRYGPDANAHVKVWRDHKIDQALDHFIANYSLVLVAHAGRVG